MESSIVNARVPLAKKEASAGILRQLGVTASDLINSAYDYVIAEKRLPQAGGLAQAGGVQPADPARFAGFLADCTLDVPWPANDGRSYKELIAEGRARDYESLA